MVECEITLDFAEALNVELDNGTREAKATIGAYRSEIVAVLRAFDVEWTTKCKVTVTKRSFGSMQTQRELL